MVGPERGQVVSSVEQQVLSVAIGEIRGLIQPSPKEREAAFQLLVELASRTASFRVTAVDGTVRDSLAAIDEMFELTRSILRSHGLESAGGSAGNLSLAVIAVRVLNEVFAPVLARWGPRLDDHESRRALDGPDVAPVAWERRWAWSSNCRSELDAMSASVRAYLDTLGRIAGAPEVADAVLHPPSSRIFEHQPFEPVDLSTTEHLEDAQPRIRMVRWLDLVEMWRTGLTKLHKAEPQAPPDAPVAPAAEFDAKRGEDFWFDYVSDFGDGFDGTAPVAYLVGRNRIHIPEDRSGEFPSPPASLPRARLLVFGGDQVYPYATAKAYRNQAELPYCMGVEPPVEGAPAPPPATLVTVPGNHDWLGGIEHFEQVFTAKRTGLFAGHWETPQSRLYWHVRLPQGWWLWGIDTGLHNEWPAEQVAYFEKAAEELTAGDRVVLCSPVPLWQLRQKYPEAYVRLRSALDPIIAGRQATMPLCLSGDSHFFAQYERIESEDREDHITAGGGGAFLQPTHNLAERIPQERGNAEFKLSSRWPLPTDSRSLAADASRALDPKNWALAGLFALFHLAYAGLLALDPWSWTWEFDAWLVGDVEVTGSGPWSWLVLVLFVVAGAFSLKPNHLESKLARGARIYGVLAGVVLALTFVVVAALRGASTSEPSAWWTASIWLLASALVGGLLSLAVLLSAAKWANARVRAGDTLAFSPAHSTRFKHFLRCRIDRSGDLTVYVVGIDPVGEGWYEAMTKHKMVPPFDRAGIPRIHYVWGRAYPKFVPVPMEIALSASEPDGAEASSPHDAILQLGKKVIDGGHTLMYGGLPPSYGGITAQLRQVEVQRHAGNPNAGHHLVNYVHASAERPEASEQKSPVDREVMRTVPMPQRPGAEHEDAVLREVRDLTAMRRRMTEDADVRIVIGGALRPGGVGERIAPGVIEEAYLALQAGLPLLVVGGFGGAARLIADALLDRLDPARVAELETHFFDPAVVAGEGEEPVGLREMLAAFSSLGQLRNELLDGENRELMTTCDPDTIERLVWASLRRLGRRRMH